MALTEGTVAPDFALPDDTGAVRRLSEFRGKYVVLYFYPEDDTPGCTKEACNFRDDYSAYEKAGVEILGVSADSVKSHGKFKAKYHLPFPLLADTDKAVINAYGVWGDKKLFGHEYEGILRTTFVIGPDGKIVKVFEKLRADLHNQEVLAALNQAQS